MAFHSVTKVFRHRPSLFNCIGRERGGETVALNSVSITAQAGEVLVLLGPNGSGKTTFLKLIATMLLPDHGAILVQGFDTCREPQRARAGVGFAVATERSFYPRLTARENLEFFASLEDLPRPLRARRVTEVLDRTGLGDAADTLVMWAAPGSRLRVGSSSNRTEGSLKFSSGMHQRLGISRALLWEWLRATAREGRTILLASHNFNEAFTAGDRVAVLHLNSVSTCRKELSTDSPPTLRTPTIPLISSGPAQSEHRKRAPQPSRAWQTE